MSLLHCTVSQTLSGRAQWTCLGAFALGLAFIAEVASANGPQCNTRSGFVANQPEENPLNAAAEEVESTQPVARVASPSEPRQKETIPVHLSQLEGLLGFPGRYTNGVPVLGLRLENYPAFDPLKNCNRVAVVMVKPRIDPIGPSRWRASVEDGRFAIEFGEELDNRALVQDPDASNRFFWVFPASSDARSVRRTVEPDSSLRRGLSPRGCRVTQTPMDRRGVFELGASHVPHAATGGGFPRRRYAAAHRAAPAAECIDLQRMRQWRQAPDLCGHRPDRDE